MTTDRRLTYAALDVGALIGIALYWLLGPPIIAVLALMTAWDAWRIWRPGPASPPTSDNVSGVDPEQHPR